MMEEGYSTITVGKVLHRYADDGEEETVEYSEKKDVVNELAK